MAALRRLGACGSRKEAFLHRMGNLRRIRLRHNGIYATLTNF